MRAEQAFHDRDDVFAVDEGHLHVELGEFRLAIGARVFIAETADDLHVFVAAATIKSCLKSCGDCGRA